MKVSWETFIPLFITVAGGLIVWGLKAVITAMRKSIVQECNDRLHELEEKVAAIEEKAENTEKTADRNGRRIDFIIEKLIERNS